MNLKQMHNIYLIGAGGIGMSALARYFMHQGANVFGYDKTPSPLTDELIREGMHFHFEDAIHCIPEKIIQSAKEHCLIIYTPAIPANHNVLNYLKQQGYTIMKRAEVLGKIALQYKTLAIAGTHGKTTTTTMIAHVLFSAGFPMVAFLGGISANYQTNYLIQGTPEFCVVEADEYDRSFLQLNPYMAVITSTDADHLDIYGKHEDVKESFVQFTHRVKKDGLLAIKNGIDINIPSGIKTVTYHANNEATYVAKNLEVVNGGMEYDVYENDKKLSRFRLEMGGLHNVENSLAAIAICRNIGIEIQNINNALQTFRGVKRRFEKITENSKYIYFDDYAHHPEEIKATINGLRMIYPNRRILGIFQPHLYSRTKDFYKEFAASLSMLDELILLDIYPARELPIQGISSEIILQHVGIQNKTLTNKEKLISTLKEKLKENDLVVTMGAGDIDRFVNPIAKMLNHSNPIQA
ncbi:MAG: UDP-N-acetylmuramate--L-alanine ligase [Flavobacteriales bacterium]|nr:UDP-N-acetylmuramate--L-alanine ligase [Flavobacteriales bacterium]